MNVFKKLVEIGAGEIDVDYMRARRECGRRHIIEIRRRLAVENDVERLLPHDACGDIRSRAQRGGARVQLSRGNLGAEVSQQAAVAGARHFRLHIG